MPVAPRSVPDAMRTGAHPAIARGWVGTSPLVSLGAGAALIAVAMLVKLGVALAVAADVSYLPLFMVLPIAVILAGPVAGATVTIAGVVVDAVLFTADRGSAGFSEPGTIARLVLFVPIGLWLTLLVTALIRLRREAATEADRLSDVIRALPGIAVLADRGTGRIQYVSPAIEAVGWDPGTLIGRSVDELLPDLPPHGGPGAGRPVNTALVAKDGSEVSVEVGRAEVQLGERAVADLLVAHDLSSQVERENQLVRLAAAERRTARSMQAIIESVDAGVAVIGTGGEVGMVNGALTALAGGPVATRADLEARLGTPLVPGEVHVPTSGRWLRLSIDDTDESELVIVRDLTTEREAAATQEAFMGVLSHELRTPVTTILGLAHLMGRPQIDATRTAEFAGDIVGEAERLEALIEDLLILSRAQGGRVAVDPEPVLLQHAIPSVVDSEAVRHPHITFATDLARDLPPAEGDRTLLAQVLRNVIGNAAKYSPRTRCTVSIIARVVGQEIEVAVRDEGPGFEPGEEDRLFDIFFRSERTARVRAGSGIGLYVSKTLVEAMQGRIWARLRPEGGAEFGFALPIVEMGDLDD